MLRRLPLVLGLLGAALLIVVIAAAVSTHDASTATKPKASAKARGRDVTRILRGIPQDGLSLGDPKAPLVLVEFADLQCPFCKEFAATSWPNIVQRYVRTGKVRMELRLISVLGEDSTTAAKAVMAASLQNRMWDASMRFYDVQGQENSGYVTDRFLRGVLGGVHGLNLGQAMKDRSSPRVLDALAAEHSLQSRYAVNSTPTVMIGPDVNDLALVSEGVPSEQQLAQAINEQLLKTV
ncbi:MAG TPA: thioredoxin domain-containing protein [Baekduia sp.]|uniref:DsbA family protein n=1 Tax=Baekduia sp. TaxID=2600305 RepID=UPI002D779EBC|nr:thioredoxin domain-containing protein [Baekduia sp.]HET6510362.1 thioredoxin domain-containing protein [Baekduia sp.]